MITRFWFEEQFMSDFLNDIDVLKEVSQILDDLGIPYMLTGSLAMNYYSEPRMTRDIDIVISLRDEDVKPVLSAFKDDYYISSDAMAEAMKYNFMFNIIHNSSMVKVDFIMRKNDEYRKTEFDRRIRVKFDGFYTYIVSKEDLIISKFIWAKDSLSQMQLKDIKNLLKSPYDKEYLTFWMEKLNLHLQFKDFLMIN
jgi:hypothetical protein